MPFIPHTQAELEQMLEVIGVSSVEQLFDEIPPALRIAAAVSIPAALDEIGVTHLLGERASGNRTPTCFLGAGSYDHHIPAAVWELAGRGEFYSAYTPYQAEASQGTLQLLYEFQTMIAGLTALEVANASLYEGASALAEAILMAVRANRKARSKKVLLPKTVHPIYRRVVQSIVGMQGIELLPLDYDPSTGITALHALDRISQSYAALVIPQPNFFGALEEVDELTDRAHQREALAIGLVNPVSLALLKPPGRWGTAGADIACGDGQPLGAPMSGGGPGFAFLACKQELVRQMPGRIVGRTLDREGQPGFTLTLQAREQHIRRAKATSNICTNQGLLATAATLHLALLGVEGLTRVAQRCHGNLVRLKQALVGRDVFRPVFEQTFFHELVLRTSLPPREVLARLLEQDLLGGYDLSRDYPELGNALLVCTTEKRTAAEIDDFAAHLGVFAA